MLLTSSDVGKTMLLLFEVVKGVVVSIFLVTSDSSTEQVWLLILAERDYYVHCMERNSNDCQL